ncbi:S-adenosyl-L-methionine-dependent methyltransferase [Neoconidiobolus thromboides FSU 785]|nr:S-adenosyl-L-methionine-dependent methyltransferase [Neoconidiobolus thromboides FSU 785]
MSLLRHTIHSSIDPSSSLNNLIKLLANRVYSGNIEHAKQEIRWLKEYINDINKIIVDNNKVDGTIATLNDDSIDNDRILSNLLRERIFKNKPLQYIIGDQPFGDLLIKVKQPILIPRWETEEWSIELANMIDEQLSKSKNDDFTILEIGSGSGCIPLMLSSKIKTKVDIYSIDKNEKATLLSQENQTFNEKQLNHKVHFKLVDLFNDYQIKKLLSSIPPVNMIVSNPPYIPPDEYELLDLSVKQWEDSGALKTKDSHGLEYYHRIYEVYKKRIRNDEKESKIKNGLPKFVFEYGTKEQGLKLKQYFDHRGFHSVLKKDMGDKYRVIYVY